MMTQTTPPDSTRAKGAPKAGSKAGPQARPQPRSKARSKVGPKAGSKAPPEAAPRVGAGRAPSGAALKLLRGRAHALRPVVMLGQHGLTDAVARELDAALDRHELVKVKLAAADAPARAAQLAALADGAGAAVVQRIGHTATLYRRNRRAPVIALPSGR